MSAHWWELWSPGLQAFGGIVELIGALFLAYEWWLAGPTNSIDLSAIEEKTSHEGDPVKLNALGSEFRELDKRSKHSWSLKQ